MKTISLSNRLFYEGLLVVLLIIGIGIANLYSALYIKNSVSPLFYKHLLWLILSFGVAGLIQVLNPNYIENASTIFYVFCCFLLLLVIFIGKKVGGAQRWLSLGFLTFQPSELIKIAMIFFLAKYFRYMPSCEGGYRLSHLAVPVLIVMFPTLIILKQPDLGTAIIVTLIAFFLILVLGVRLRLLVMSGIIFVLSTPVLWLFLKEYQKRRVTAFLSPESDPLGSGYHTIQANIAIGTGGFYGKGYLKGVQSKLGYIPEKHTDFVFSVFAEEWGLLGVGAFIILNAYLIFWMFRVVRNIQDRFLFLSGAGIIFLFAVHFVINIAMVSGLFPVVGVPLPLMSYGGTALMVNMAALSFILKLSREY